MIARNQSSFCHQLLKPLAEACDIQLQMVFALPMLNDMLSFLGSRVRCSVAALTQRPLRWLRIM
jgi:hypothetical protein